MSPAVLMPCTAVTPQLPGTSMVVKVGLMVFRSDTCVWACTKETQSSRARAKAQRRRDVIRRRLRRGLRKPHPEAPCSMFPVCTLVKVKRFAVVVPFDFHRTGVGVRRVGN